MRKRQFKDLTGMKFGRLTVLRLDHEKAKGRKSKQVVRYWFCVCDCGNTKVIRGSHLSCPSSNTVTRSCGCYVKELQASEAWRGKSRKLGTAFRRVLDQYKANAKHRGLSWELTDEQFKEITKQPCYYTGELPSNRKVVRSGEEYIYSGIDRIDSSKGYIISNCVPCCADINVMKMDLPKDRFIFLCKKVSERF
jgi:hypothetical protein